MFCNTLANVIVRFLKFIPSMFLNIPNIKQNLPTIVFFVLLILFDLFWNTNWFTSIKKIMKLPITYCYTGSQTLIRLTQ